MLKYFDFILFFIIIISFIDCKSDGVVSNLPNSNFKTKAEYLVNKEKYFYLNKLSNLYLKHDTKNFVAAYYKALSMINIYQYNKGVSFYINYIVNNEDMSSDYKQKWINLALYASNQKSIHFETSGMSFLGIDFKIKTDSNINYCQPKSIEDKEYYYYLNKNGVLYLINKLNKRIKKINYYKTNDFILLKDYLIFNDSINLIKFNLKTFKYTLITSFTTNNVKFLKINKELNKFIVENKLDLGSSLRFVDLNKNSIINIPANCVGFSNNIDLFVVEKNNNLKFIDIDGTVLLSLTGKFLGFDKQNFNIFIYTNNYVMIYNMETKKEKQLIYIPNINQIKLFKSVNEDVFFFVYDEFMILYDYKKAIPLLLKGNYLSIFKNGFFYSNLSNDKIFFISFFSFSINFLFEGKNNIKELIFSDEDSSIFSAYEDGILYIYNLNEHFPIKTR